MTSPGATTWTRRQPDDEHLEREVREDSSAEHSTLTVETVDAVATITINRAQALNALSRQTLSELKALLETLAAASFDDLRGVVITGSGERAFVAGADIREMAQMTPEEGEDFGRLGQHVTELVESLPVPVIACVNGFALGGGCELAMSADFIYCTENAVFGQPEVALGLIPGFGGCVRLQRYVGPGYAKDLIYSGRKIEATEALRIGLVNATFATKEEMLAAAGSWLHKAAASSAVAVALCKETINASAGRTTEEALELERTAFRRAFESEDMRAGTGAFLAKRPAVFPGR